MKEKIRRILPILIFTHEKSSLKNGQNWSAEGDFGIETPICEWKNDRKLITGKESQKRYRNTRSNSGWSLLGVETWEKPTANRKSEICSPTHFARLRAGFFFLVIILILTVLLIGVTRCWCGSNLGRVWRGVETWIYLTANLRELTRIAFSLRSGALLRLIAYAGIAPSLEKCYRKNRRAGFSFIVIYLPHTSDDKFSNIMISRKGDLGGLRDKSTRLTKASLNVNEGLHCCEYVENYMKRSV